MSKRKEWILLITGFAGALLGTFGVLMFNTHVLSALPTILRIILYVVGYWIIAVVPLILMYANKEKMRDYFAGKEKLLWQILIGLGIGLGMSFLLTLIPHLAGFGNFVDNGTRHDKFIEFAIEFIYFVFSVSFVEEFVFRGFIFRRLKNITGNNVISLIAADDKKRRFFLLMTSSQDAQHHNQLKIQRILSQMKKFDKIHLARAGHER